MRILYASQHPLFPMMFGGAARATHRLLERLTAAHGVECRAICSAARADLLPSETDFRALEVKAFSADGGGWSLDMGYPLRVAKEFLADLERTIAEFRPTVICSQLMGAQNVLRVGHRLGVPCLWYLHDYLPETGDGIKTLGESRRATLFVACCRFVRDWARQAHNIEASVVYPCVDLDRYAVERSSTTGLTMINPNPVKGIEALLALTALVPDLPFLIVECWPLDDRVEELRQRLAGLKNVRFMRRVVDVREVYRQTKILLVPSLREAFSLAVREAQINGIPVVASNTGGLPEVVGKGGVLVDDFENPNAWAQTVTYLYADQDRLGRLSELARENAQTERFSLSTNVEAFVEACRSAERMATA